MIDPLNIRMLGKATADPLRSSEGNVKSSGRLYARISLREGDRSLAIRLISEKICTKKPGFSLLDWLGIRKRAILLVENREGVVGYAEVYANSLWKRLRLDKKEFYGMLRNKTEDFTDYIEKKIKEQNDKIEKKGRLDIEKCMGLMQCPFTFDELLKKVEGDQSVGAHFIRATCHSQGHFVQGEDGNFKIERNEEIAKKEIGEMLQRCKTKPLREFALQQLIEKEVIEVESFLDDYPHLQVILGKLYARYHHMKGRVERFSRDEKKAFELFFRAAEKADVEGLMLLARCYSQGKGIDADKEKAKETIERLISIPLRESQKVPLEGLVQYGYKKEAGERVREGLAVFALKKRNEKWLNELIEHGVEEAKEFLREQEV